MVLQSFFFFFRPVRSELALTEQTFKPNRVTFNPPASFASRTVELWLGPSSFAGGRRSTPLRSAALHCAPFRDDLPQTLRVLTKPTFLTRTAPPQRFSVRPLINEPGSVYIEPGIFETEPCFFSKNSIEPGLFSKNSIEPSLFSEILHFMKIAKFDQNV